MVLTATFKGCVLLPVVPTLMPMLTRSGTGTFHLAMGSPPNTGIGSTLRHRAVSALPALRAATSTRGDGTTVTIAEGTPGPHPRLLVALPRRSGTFGPTSRVLMRSVVVLAVRESPPGELTSHVE